MISTSPRALVAAIIILGLSLPILPSPAQAAADPGETFAADLGLRPDPDGFNFENYTNETAPVNLTAAEVRRLFGDRVCANLAGDECSLTPPARQWMEQSNASMKNGHCEGIAVLSLLIYTGTLSADQFGGQTAWDLKLDGNPALQREIAYWYITQATDPAMSAIVENTPQRIVELLERSFEDKGQGSELYALGVYQPGHNGGHAVTPYAIDRKSDDEVWIMVYDNNVPGQARHVVVNPRANTWEYETAVNPEEGSEMYRGTASSRTLELAPITPRLQQQVCPFCDDETGATASPTRGRAASAQRYNEVWMEGNAALLLVDDRGRRFGYSQGRFYTEIPGARQVAFKGDAQDVDADVPAVLWMPAGVPFTAIVDGRGVVSPSASIDLMMIGPGYYAGVDAMSLAPGRKDQVKFSGDGAWLRYTAGYSETPNLAIGFERDGADYELNVIARRIQPGAVVQVNADSDRGTMTLQTQSSARSAVYSLQMLRIGDTDEISFEGPDITLQPRTKLTVDFAAWDANGESLEATLDDGRTVKTIDLADEQ